MADTLAPSQARNTGGLVRLLPKAPSRPATVYYGHGRIQVCVPGDMADHEIVAYAEFDYPAGTPSGWQIVGRCECAHYRAFGWVHVTLSAGAAA